MVSCDVWWSDAKDKDCSYGGRKNYTNVLGVFMRVETEKMYLYPLSMEMHYLRLKRKLVYMLVVDIWLIRHFMIL